MSSPAAWSHSFGSLAIIGTINRDSIHLPSGKITESFGGILYNVLTAALINPRIQLFPVCNIGYDIYARIVSYLQPFSSVRTEYLQKASQTNNHAHLYHDQSGNMREQLSGNLPRLKWEQVMAILNCQIILLNFISGRELLLSTLRRMRAAATGLFFVDLHSLTLDKKADGWRTPRRPVRWWDYVKCADFLQLNRTEFELLAETAVTVKSLVSGTRLFHSFGPRCILVTLGTEGAFVSHRVGRSYQTGRCRVPRVDRIVDTTGCGDVFSAAFVSHYFEKSDIFAAARFAVEVASHKATFSGIEALERLKKFQLSP